MTQQIEGHSQPDGANIPDSCAKATSANAESSLLFERFRNGDEAAFRELYRRHNERLLLYALKIVGERQAAEDITQEMWERMIGMRGQDTDVRNPIGLMVRIARNLCIDHLRKRRRELTMDEWNDESPAMSVQTRQTSELEDMALAALERLPFDYREVLVLNLYCGYRYDEIAVMLDRSPDAIWARASRARTQLRRMVAASISPAQPSTGSDGNNATPRSPMHRGNPRL